MTDRPIIFSAPMVRALLEGSKTQERRILKPQPFIDAMGNAVWGKWNFGQNARNEPHIDHIKDCNLPRHRFPFRVGDRLWVRETWQVAQKFTDVVEVRYRASERASHTEFVEQIPIAIALNASVTFPKWRSPIHMPRWASRLTLTVTDVRVQRLQDMEGQHPSESDAIAEGVNKIHHGDGDYYYSAFRNEPHPKNWCDPTDAFRELWNGLHGPDAWDANPWVAALTFTVERRNIDAVDSDGDVR